MVITCLKASELYQWLIRFAGSILNIGCIRGARAVFNKYTEYHAYWKNKKIEVIPSYTKGLKYKETYIDDMITLLQTGKIKFQFLEYLSTNPGINLHELENLAYYAYRTMADGAMPSSSR